VSQDATSKKRREGRMTERSGPKRPVEEYYREREQRYWNGEMPDKIWDGNEPVSDITFIDRYGRPDWKKEKERQRAKIKANKQKAYKARKKDEIVEFDQHLPIFFEVLDNPKFRNGLMKKDRWRTYLWLARNIVRARMKNDPLRLYENYFKKGKLAACIPTRVLARTLNIGRQTAQDHIDALEKDGLIIKDTISGKNSWDGQRYTVCIFGVHKNKKQRWFIQDAFGVSGK
jgi:hypothetical protein